MKHPDEGIYKRGLAVGQSNIRTDTMTFRFRDELFEFPLGDALTVAKYNGRWYEAKVKALRAMSKKQNENVV